MGPTEGRPAAAVILAALLQPAVLKQQCPLRNCLPPDDTQSPPLCYQQTTIGIKPATQSFAKCPEDNICEYCVTQPPCESRCTAQSRAQRPPGAECYFDEQCRPPFAKCLQRRCKRALHTHQRCDPENVNDVCIYGQKSCFRNRCQGLPSGQPCFEGHKDGRDIDCNPGWYCFLAVCTPQLPAGHGCKGQHPHECVDGYRCNTALDAPVCERQYTLSLGKTSGDATLCRSNHVDPRSKKCAAVPAVEMRFGKPVVNSRDCASDAQCPRTDTSLGKCICKQWWTGDGTPSYCELAVQDSRRPSFKQFWEAGVRLCHHDWTPERCAQETGLINVLKTINNEERARASDPTNIAECGMQMLTTQFVDVGGACRSAGMWPVLELVGAAAATGWLASHGP